MGICSPGVEGCGAISWSEDLNGKPETFLEAEYSSVRLRNLGGYRLEDPHTYACFATRLLWYGSEKDPFTALTVARAE